MRKKDNIGSEFLEGIYQYGCVQGWSARKIQQHYQKNQVPIHFTEEQAEEMLEGMQRNCATEPAGLVERSVCHGDIHLLTIKMEFIDSTNVSALERAVDDCLAAGAHHLIIDFGQVQFMSSAGFHVLIRGLRRLRADGGDLKLVGLESLVAEVFHVLSLSDHFDVRTSIDEAVALF